MSVSSLSLSASPPPQLPMARKPVAIIPCRLKPLLARHEVAGELVADELVVGQVAVEGVDDPVAVAPGVARSPSPCRWQDAGVERVGVAGQVEPVPAPALAVGRRRQQAVHHLGEGVGRFVLEEGVHLLRRRRQAGQVEGRPADQRPLVGGLRRLEALRLQGRQNVAVQVGARPGLILDGRRRDDLAPAGTPRNAAARR